MYDKVTDWPREITSDKLMLTLVGSLESRTTETICASWPFTATAKPDCGKALCRASLKVSCSCVPSKLMPPTNTGGVRSVGSSSTSVLLTLSVRVWVEASSCWSVCEMLPAMSTVRTTKVCSPPLMAEPV